MDPKRLLRISMYLTLLILFGCQVEVSVLPDASVQQDAGNQDAGQQGIDQDLIDAADSGPGDLEDAGVPDAGSDDGGLVDGGSDASGDNYDPTPDVCDQNPFDPLCNQQCVDQQDCGPNLHCGPDGTCQADCIPYGDECGPGYMCYEHGLCTEICASAEGDAILVVPTVVFLIDQSSSMNGGFGGQSRWEAVKSALTHSADALIPALEDEILFGATLYTSDDGFSGGDCPILTHVLPALNNAAAITNLLTVNDPVDETPTGDSLAALVDELESLPPDALTTPRLIVLATDGDPDTCEQPNPQNGEDEAVQAAQDAYSRGYETIILSVDDDVSSAHLQDMANAGAGLPVNGFENAPYYVANNPGELTVVFEEILQGVRSCTFILEGETIPLDEAQYGEVLLGGVEIPFDDPNGWRLIDEQTLELVGEACQRYKDDGSLALSAKFPCGLIK